MEGSLTTNINILSSTTPVTYTVMSSEKKHITDNTIIIRFNELLQLVYTRNDFRYSSAAVAVSRGVFRGRLTGAPPLPLNSANIGL